ncbi:hypothetical protein V5799_009418 [Amblyomma americanum]|uniref:Uncharacterized protein n=1 Tax=Amblyomma americanum TaxID=6943 RepID=A0AAQ4FAE4_AMBAM
MLNILSCAIHFSVNTFTWASLLFLYRFSLSLSLSHRPPCLSSTTPPTPLSLSHIGLPATKCASGIDRKHASASAGCASFSQPGVPLSHAIFLMTVRSSLKKHVPNCCKIHLL